MTVEPTWLWLLAFYTGASGLCFAAYAFDKRAAQAGRRRVPEATLLALGLIGGWPGGLLAQRTLRHKTRKVHFLVPFWVTVVLNIAAVVAVASVL